VYDVRVPGLLKRRQADIVSALNRDGIAARYCFQPMHQQPEFRNECRVVTRADGLWQSQAFRAASEVFYLPVDPGVTTTLDCSRAFEIITRVLS
jgi:dTDP-4-amino-4,6-dideoxygalactose transaminase